MDIRIVNDAEEEIYSATKSVFRDDYDPYTSQAAGEQYLAKIRGPAPELTPGSSTNGKVYLTVYKGDALRFDEVNCAAV